MEVEEELSKELCRFVREHIVEEAFHKLSLTFLTIDVDGSLNGKLGLHFLEWENKSIHFQLNPMENIS